MPAEDKAHPPQPPERTPESWELQQQQIVEIPLDQLLPHPDNPRGEVTAESVEELVASIEANGLDEPLIVVPIGTPGRAWLIKAYRVVIVHRRLQLPLRRAAAVQRGHGGGFRPRGERLDRPRMARQGTPPACLHRGP